MFFTVIRVIFVILGIIGLNFALPLTVAICNHEYDMILPFLIPMLISIAVAIIFVFAGKGKSTRLTTRASFVIVALAWVSVCIFGSIPFIFSPYIKSFTDCVFESVAGFSTTGATILDDVEVLPRSLNLWRCQSHWLGGLGIVALTVALFPILGIGGFQLIKAETTGPEKGKFTPKITTTAKYLWFIYLALTVSETILLMIGGMDFIDALAHSFSTVGTGGFSTKNDSIAFYNSVYIDTVCTIYMFLASINFTLYFYMLKGKFKEIIKNTEFRVFLGIVFGAIIIVTLIQENSFHGFFKSLRFSAFQVLTIMSTTGFSTNDYTQWLPASQGIIFILFFIGGCSGSTAGGVKVVRWCILFKQMSNELKKLIHPHGVFNIRLNKEVGRKDVVYAVSAFIFIYFILIFVSTFFTALFGIDLFTSFTASMSMISNIGPAFNFLGPSYTCATLPVAVKWWFCFLMIAGRLEIFTMIVFFTPDYWRK